MVRKRSGLLPFATVAFLTALRAVAQPSPAPGTPQTPQWYWEPGPWHMGSGGYGWHFWWMGPLMMLLMIVGCIALVFLVTRGPWRGGWSPGGAPMRMVEQMTGTPTHSALRILNERFARGEIQKDEYEDKKATILLGERPHGERETVSPREENRLPRGMMANRTHLLIMLVAMAGMMAAVMLMR